MKKKKSIIIVSFIVFLFSVFFFLTMMHKKDGSEELDYVGNCTRKEADIAKSQLRRLIDAHSDPYVTHIRVALDEYLQRYDTFSSQEYYLTFDVSEQEGRDIARKIENIEMVNRVEYISQEQALQRFKTASAQDQFLIDTIEDLGKEGVNPLPASLVVHAAEGYDYTTITSEIDQTSFKSKILHVNNLSYTSQKNSSLPNYYEDLDRYDKSYYQGSFMVYGMGDFTGGGQLITIIPKENPDRAFEVWVYKLDGGGYDLRAFDDIGKSADEIKTMMQDYHCFLGDDRLQF